MGEFSCTMTASETLFWDLDWQIDFSSGGADKYTGQCERGLDASERARDDNADQKTEINLSKRTRGLHKRVESTVFHLYLSPCHLLG